MALKDDKGRWIDPTGNPVPPKYIGQDLKRLDKMVEKLFRQAELTQERLVKFKALIKADISKYLDWLANTKGEDVLNPGGTYKLPTFSGDKRIQIGIGKYLEFGVQLHLAKTKIDKCLEKWSENADDKIKILIFDAFKVNNKGLIDTKRILHLRTLKIKDTEWQAAMELITEAVIVTGTKQYFYFQTRDQDGAWKTMRLDLAGV